MPFDRVTRAAITHVKAGLFGPEASGKTRTAAELAALTYRRAGATRGVLMIDTEGGSDFVAEIFEASGIPFYVKKTRAFVDVVAALDEAVAEVDLVIIDSLTHVYRELMAEYLAARGRKVMEKGDWLPLKAEWAPLVERVVSLPVHIIVCGRLGWVYEDYYDAERDRYDSARTGQKMAGDSEFGYEPNVTIAMSREELPAGGFELVATCTKDRFVGSPILGKVFRFPVEDGDPAAVAVRIELAFGPHLDRYAFDASPVPVDVAASSAALFAAPDRSRERYRRNQAIEVEKIDALFQQYLSGMSAADKRARVEIRMAVFETASETEIAGMHPDRLSRCRMLLAGLFAQIEADAKDGRPATTGVDALRDLIAAIEDQGDREPAVAGVGNF